MERECEGAELERGGRASERALWFFGEYSWRVPATLYVFVRAPAVMVLASGTAQALTLPILGGAALFFRCRRLDARLRPGRLWDAFLWLATAGFVGVPGRSIYSRFLG